MLSKTDELHIRISQLEETEQQYLVRILEEKTGYYQERIKQIKHAIEQRNYDRYQVKQYTQYLETFKQLLHYNMRLTDKIR